MNGYVGIGVFFIVVVLAVLLLHFLTHSLGEKAKIRADIPYESGVLPSGTAQVKFPVDYFLVAMFFVIFDAGAVFLFAWAVAAKQLGWSGYIAIVIFILETVAALYYIILSGALDWGKLRGKAHKIQATLK